MFGDHAVVQRCVVHKERNVLSYLPEKYQGTVRQRLRAAWSLTEYSKAKAALLKVGKTTPLLSVERVSYTYKDVPMELRRGLYLTDAHHYRNTLN